MHRWQKIPGETLQNPQIAPQAEHSSYVAPNPRMSEAKYPSLQKEGIVAGDIRDLGGRGGFNAQGANGLLRAETEIYSSISPPIDEQTMMQPIGNVWNQRNGNLTKGMSSLHTANSPGSPSPIYNETHGMEHGSGPRFVFSVFLISLPHGSTNVMG
jgi:hypothetical protein